jgi:hypothetical protein
MKGMVSQSNYIPWIGYFYSINNVDIFAVYDDVQYTKRDWRNRNLINTPNGLKWLTIPICVKGNFLQKINEAKVSDRNWNIDHWNIIKENYRNTKYFNEISLWLEPLYKQCSYQYLSDINLFFIESICNYLKIRTNIVFSPISELVLDKNERLIQVCRDLSISEYYSGPSAKKYLDISFFSKESIHVNFWDYEKFIEERKHILDLNHVSIIDLLFNEGPNVSLII